MTPPNSFRLQATLLLAYVLCVTAAAAYLRFDPLELVREFGHVADVADRAWPPNFSLLWKRPSLFTSLGETFSVAFLGTLLGGISALAISLLAASNTTPHPWVRFLARSLLAIERSLPVFVVLLVVQIAVGFGPFSSALAIFIGSIGMFGKLFADAIESVEPGPVESIAAIGGSRWQQIRYGVLPAALPSIVAHWLYAYDVNLRHAIALGVVGGGGLGFEFYLAQKLLRHDDMLALALFISVLVFATERISDFIRSRILASAVLK